jgi:hypothetical protein
MIINLLGIVVFVGAALYFKSVIPMGLLFVYMIVVQNMFWRKYPDSRSRDH